MFRKIMDSQPVRLTKSGGPPPHAHTHNIPPRVFAPIPSSRSHLYHSYPHIAFATNTTYICPLNQNVSVAITGSILGSWLTLLSSMASSSDEVCGPPPEDGDSSGGDEVLAPPPQVERRGRPPGAGVGRERRLDARSSLGVWLWEGSASPRSSCAAGADGSDAPRRAPTSGGSGRSWLEVHRGRRRGHE